MKGEDKVLTVDGKARFYKKRSFLSTDKQILVLPGSHIFSK